MKKFTKTIILLFALMSMNYAYSQTTIYADTVLAFSSEYSSSIWGSSKILGVPNVYPSCGDFPESWTFYCVTSRQWIEIGYNTQLYVDTIRIYETNRSGFIDTVYLRNSATGNWNSIYVSTSIPNYSCNIFDIVVPTTSYKVDAIRLAIAADSSLCYPEYDAVALIGTTSTTSISENKLNNFTIFPNPSNGNFTLNSTDFTNSVFGIFNVVGEMVYSKKIKNNIENISLDLPSGIYFSSFEKNGKKETQKLIIK